MRTYLRLWLLLSLLVTYEYLALRFAPDLSVLDHLKSIKRLPKELNLSTRPGKTISLWLGWLGFGIMALTNIYSLRKRFHVFKKIGELKGWLDFHIFCGLLGPVLILFHTDFKIGGLVAISFWSMVVGRYFYLQLVSNRAELERIAQISVNSLESSLARYRLKLSPEQFGQLKFRSLALAGASGGQVGVLGAITSSFWGDLRFSHRLRKVIPGLPLESADLLKTFAINQRKALYLGQFQKVMGYWHSFHLPFAIFMYVVAFIHIGTALVMMVPE